MKKLVCALLVIGAGPALAASPGAQLAQEECSACHIAYPAQMLPDASWNAIMSDLSNHFGEDASLDAAATEEIRAYLTGKAPSRMRGVDPLKPVLRISELPWFTREHGSRLRARALADPNIATMSNCTACHRQSGQGMYDDD